MRRIRFLSVQQPGAWFADVERCPRTVASVCNNACSSALSTSRRSRFEVKLDGATVSLTPVEFRLLKTLAAAPGRIYSRDQLMDKLYEDRRVVLDRTVDTHVKNVRRKLARIAPEEDIIRSIYGVGYKLELPWP